MMEFPHKLNVNSIRMCVVDITHKTCSHISSLAHPPSFGVFVLSADGGAAEEDGPKDGYDSIPHTGLLLTIILLLVVC